MSGHFVICPACGEQHDTDDVKFIDISEGDRGQDVMTFECPTTKEEVSSNVYRGRPR